MVVHEEKKDKRKREKNRMRQCIEHHIISVTCCTSYEHITRANACFATLTFPERLGESDGALLGFPLNDGLSLGADDGC